MTLNSPDGGKPGFAPGQSTADHEQAVPYAALYRRWRPQLFSEVLGQEHVTRSLQNALAKNRIAHAYLFCGLRGTGKTTMAKLLGKALNCLEGVNSEPCNRCRSCVEVTEGRNLDVLEIDAASNRGIDEIRELREKVRYAAAQNRYKVYIIDEVHMLTSEAFNALLKVLEEPPPKVVFVLATTEAHKIPLTIVSRCQRYDFHLLEVEQLAGRLRAVAAEMDFTVDDKTLILLARQAEGAVRDALGLLEQSRAYGGEAITYEQALEILGLPAPEILHRYYQAVIDENLAAGLAVIREVIQQGMDLQRLLREQVLYLRKLLLLQAEAAETTTLADVPALKPYLLQHRDSFKPALILEMLEILQQLVYQLRGVSQPQFLLELAFLRLVRVYRFRSYFSPDELVRRLEALEEKLLAAGQGRLESADHDRQAVSTHNKEKNSQDVAPWDDPVRDDNGDTGLPIERPQQKEAPQPLEEGRHSAASPEPAASALNENTAATEPQKEQLKPLPLAETAAEEESSQPATETHMEKDTTPLDAAGLAMFWKEHFLAELKKERKYNLLAYLMEAAPLSWKGGIFAVAIPPKRAYLKKRLETEKNKKYIGNKLRELLNTPAEFQVIIQEHENAGQAPEEYGSGAAEHQNGRISASDVPSPPYAGPAVSPQPGGASPPAHDQDFMRKVVDLFQGSLIEAGKSGDEKPWTAKTAVDASFAIDDVPLPDPPPPDEDEEV